MLPIIFSTGSLTVYTFGFLLALGVFLKTFINWRRLKELGFKEEKIIDFLIFGLLLGVVFSRLTFIIENWQEFGFQPERWFFFIRFPGFSVFGWALGFFLALWRFAKKEKWDFWQVADEVSFGILPFLILLQVGSFLDGSGFGRTTTMPWGIYFPGILLKRHPLSLFSSILLFAIWFFLLKIERHWRVWEWYKSKESGFIFLLFSGLVLLTNLPLAFLKESEIYFYWTEILLNLFGFLSVLLFFYIRSGRSFKKAYGKEKKEDK